ncbi:MAG: phosphate ABC transporter permease subunit PstC [Armatimonadota bacterium]
MEATYSAGLRPRPQLIISDKVFNVLLGVAGAVVLALIAILGSSLAFGSSAALKVFGWHFTIGTNWDPVKEDFGALPFIYGTLMSSILALLIAVPVGVGTGIFLAEIAPKRLAEPLAFVIELLAAVPSVVYGMWGIFVIVPLMRSLQEYAGEHWSNCVLLSGPPVGVGLLTASVVLAIMILPFIAAISKDSLQAVPRTQAEAGLALGSTRWETISGPVLRYARKGIFGGIILALGRALGETMAVTMLIGNNPQITASLFRSAYSMSAVIANEFSEATGDLHTSALVSIALVLLVLTLAVNALARLLIWGVVSQSEGKAA